MCQEKQKSITTFGGGVPATAPSSLRYDGNSDKGPGIVFLVVENLLTNIFWFFFSISSSISSVDEPVGSSTEEVIPVSYSIVVYRNICLTTSNVFRGALCE